MRSNSWVITRKDTGAGVVEIHNPALVIAINRDKYAVHAAHRYLYALNAAIKTAGGAQPSPGALRVAMLPAKDKKPCSKQ